MEYLAIVRLRAIADAAAATSALPQTGCDNANHGALVHTSTPSAVDKVAPSPVSPPKSKGVKGPILLCVSSLSMLEIIVEYRKYKGSSVLLGQVRLLWGNQSRRPWIDHSSGYPWVV